MKRYYVLGYAALIAIFLLALLTAHANAATRLVAPGGSDATNCLAEPCATIQHAIDEAGSGDLVQVAAGTYAEAVTVNKASLTLRGAQAGLARPGQEVPGAQESVIKGPGTTPLVTIAADAAKVEGLAFQAPEGDAIRANQGTRITNLAVTSDLRSSGDGTLLSAGNAESLVVRDNRVVNTSAPAVFLAGNTNASLVEANEFAHGTSTAIQLAGGLGANSEVAIVGNDLREVARGVRLGPGSVGTGVVVRENLLADESLFGIVNEQTAAFDARRNWWGCNGGPGASGCSTLSNVGTAPDSSDWLALALAAEPATTTAGDPAALRAELDGSASGTRAAAIPDGTVIGFGTSLGEISGVGGTVGGRATASFLAKLAGTADVSASLDSQVVHLPLTVVPAPEPPPDPRVIEVPVPVFVPVPGPASPAPAAPPRTITLLLPRERAEVAGGRAKVIASCAAAVGQRCTGELRLGVAGSTARASFDLGAGRRASISVRVPRAALERLDRSPRATVTAQTRQDEGGGEPVVSQRRLRLASAGAQGSLLGGT